MPKIPDKIRETVPGGSREFQLHLIHQLWLEKQASSEPEDPPEPEEPEE